MSKTGPQGGAGKPIGMFLDNNVMNEIRKVAKEENRPMGRVVRQALIEFLQRRQGRTWVASKFKDNYYG